MTKGFTVTCNECGDKVIITKESDIPDQHHVIAIAIEDVAFTHGDRIITFWCWGCRNGTEQNK